MRTVASECVSGLYIGQTYLFFQAEDGIRDWSVTGVQTCALPISFNEISPNGEEYFQYFRWGCDQYGVRIVALETITQTPDDLEGSLVRLREARPDALAYMGYGYPTILLAPIVAKLGWEPSRIVTTALEFAYAKPE